MCPDSKIAKSFSCGKTKYSYLINFALVLYFHDILMSKLRQSSVKYVISFDETNKVLQSEQMDTIVPFWDNQENKVCSRYFDSKFLGHTTPEKLLQSLKTSLDKLNPANLIQISMDSPHMNWKLLEDFVKDRTISDPEIPHLINVGSCGLHIVHGAFKTGATTTDGTLATCLNQCGLHSVNPQQREKIT